jgi:hypothetical protein
MSKILINYFEFSLKYFLKSVSECYKNQKRIDQACKQLTSQSNLLMKQSQAWITLIGQFTDALKVCFVFIQLNKILY